MFVSLMGQTFQEEWQDLEHLSALILISSLTWSSNGASGKAAFLVPFAGGGVCPPGSGPGVQPPPAVVLSTAGPCCGASPGTGTSGVCRSPLA